MLNDPELLMLFAREKQEELRRTMRSVQRSSFRQALGVLLRPTWTSVRQVRSARPGSVNQQRSQPG